MRDSNSRFWVDCGAIAPSLLESELFGALKGSYTGADRDRIGVLEAASKGNKSHAAKILGIERKTLYRKLERMGMS